MDGSVVFARWHQCDPIYRKPKIVSMATTLRHSILAMSSSARLTPKPHPLESNSVSITFLHAAYFRPAF